MKECWRKLGRKEDSYYRKMLDKELKKNLKKNIAKFMPKCRKEQKSQIKKESSLTISSLIVRKIS
jgi:hypothetical protein